MTGKNAYLLVCVLLALPVAGRANDWASTGGTCYEAVSLAEHQAGIPTGLLSAISRVESGRRDPLSGKMVAWPWTVNAAGRGYFYASKAEAIAAVEDFQHSGIVSIDVGCMQINLHHHANAFLSLDEAFDPVSNARYGALFLRNLFTQFHAWPAATGAYHSLTPILGEEYEQHVMAVWNGKDDVYRPPDFLPQVVMTGNGPKVIMPQDAGPMSVQPQSVSPQRISLASASASQQGIPHVIYGPPPRVIRRPDHVGGVLSGRGRDLMSYRTTPVRLAWRQN